MTTPLRGVVCAVLTPFNPDYTPNTALLVAHARWLRRHGAGLAVFGDGCEWGSLGADERMDVLDQLVEAGIEPTAILPATGSCALPETVRMARHAVRLGCAGVLVAPPQNPHVSPEGLYRYYAQVVEQVADKRLRLYLSHRGDGDQADACAALVERLLHAFPDTVAGLQDASVDWGVTQAFISRFAGHGLDVFAGSETFLLATLRSGGAGCISATANINPAAIQRLCSQWQHDSANAQQEELSRVPAALRPFPLVPAMKCVIAHRSGDTRWNIVRPPLVELESRQGAQLLSSLRSEAPAAAGLFELPNITHERNQWTPAAAVPIVGLNHLHRQP